MYKTPRDCEQILPVFAHCQPLLFHNSFQLIKKCCNFLVLFYDCWASLQLFLNFSKYNPLQNCFNHCTKYIPNNIFFRYLQIRDCTILAPLYTSLSQIKALWEDDLEKVISDEDWESVLYCHTPARKTKIIQKGLYFNNKSIRKQRLAHRVHIGNNRQLNELKRELK